MEITSLAKKRFTKDTNVPIHVYSEPHFSYFLNLYNPFYNSIEKFEDLKKCISELGSENTFFSELNRLVTEITNKISIDPKISVKDKSGYFSTSDFTSKNIYSPEFNESVFISIDLKEANFQSLEYLDPEIFNRSANFRSYLTSYTYQKYFLDSKYLRQVIFGNLNPKKQQQTQKHIMLKVLDQLNKDHGIGPNDAFFMSSDEIILHYKKSLDYDLTHLKKVFDNVVSSTHSYNISSGNSFRFSIQAFEVFRLSPQNIYIKMVKIPDPVKSITKWDETSVPQIKNSPQYFIPQIIKYIKGESINDYDLVFYFENQLCSFNQPLKFDYGCFEEQLKGVYDAIDKGRQKSS